MDINSKDYNLTTIIEKGFSFNIPRYQRLFVWEDEQVKTFFNDILTAYTSKKPFYYIGGIITVKYEKIDKCFDLVDGQQRFTVLWLLANELGIKKYTERNNDLRLNFSIRENVKTYFKKLLDFSKIDAQEDNFEDLIRISKAKKTLNHLINNNLKDDKKAEFIDFLLNKVKMVITDVPLETDLNKLFETLNNRGVQLNQHEILKANFLSEIHTKKNRFLYNALWSISSNMNDYLERNIAKEVGSARDTADTLLFDNYTFDWKKVKALINNNFINKNKNLGLKEILTKVKKNDLFEDLTSNKKTNALHPDHKEDELEKVRSILTFPQLLLHTLRIYRHQKALTDIQRINEKELLSTFDKYYFTKEYLELGKKEKQKENKYFINLLAKVREVFDKYIIKWVQIDENTEIHLIKKIIKRNRVKGSSIYYIRREKTNNYDGYVLLQSILYHSQQNTTQYWLTPILNYLLNFISFEDAYIDLKKTDNILFSSNQDNKLPERTWMCMNDEYPEIEQNCDILKEKFGVGFPHYWFYKMEFVLWHERHLFEKANEWEKYRMTARNSVEHISPQNPDDDIDRLCVSELDAWGNLVLVTRSINSEYSNYTFKRKKSIFEEKKSKGKLDSLKSDIIYQNDNWSDEDAIAHQNEMIDLMNNYFHKINKM